MSLRLIRFFRPAYQEFHILANSYRYAYSNKKALYFAVVDYEEAPQIFQMMNLNTAPVLYHFPAKGNKKRADQMDFQRHGFDAESMAKFVLDRTEISVGSTATYHKHIWKECMIEFDDNQYRIILPFVQKSCTILTEKEITDSSSASSKLHRSCTDDLVWHVDNWHFIYEERQS